MIPSAVRLLSSWNLISAVLVFSPVMPSGVPQSYPLSFRACWTCLVSSVSASEAGAEVVDWVLPDEAAA